jgi:hypothetical protein
MCTTAMPSGGGSVVVVTAGCLADSTVASEGPDVFSVPMATRKTNTINTNAADFMMVRLSTMLLEFVAGVYLLPV